MHSEFEEFFVVLTEVPAVVLHFLAEYVKLIGVLVLRVAGEELTTLRLSECHEFGSNGTRQFARLAKKHAPDVVGDERPTLLALLHLHYVGECHVLNVLAERRYQRRITHLGPYVCYLVEEFYHQLVLSEFGQVVFFLVFVDGFEVALEVGHERTHHAAGQTGSDEERVHETVSLRDVVAEEVVHHLLDECAHFHVRAHVDFLNVESCVLQHRLNGEDVHMASTPRERLHAYVHVVATSLADFQYGCHSEARTSVRVVFYYDVLVILDAFYNLAEFYGTADARHVLDAYFVRAGVDELLGEVYVVFNSVDGAFGDAEAALRNHVCAVGACSLVCVTD